MLLLKRLAGIGLGLILLAAPALAQSVTVMVNGSPVTFDQPPVMRAGRVYVPLRGVFQQLGATVVYANGIINAQGNGRSVHLRIGSNQATVNGSPVALDSPPFLIGARTLVPLRFVAQALGANVNWNNANSTVYIGRGAGGAMPMPPQETSGLRLVDRDPYPTAISTSPIIKATFTEPIDRNSLHVMLDNRDLTSLTYASPTSFYVTPDYQLSLGRHTVTVSGTTQNGQSFTRSWEFTARNATGANFINDIRPAPNSGGVGNNFTLVGATLPGSSIHVVAQATQTLIGIFPIGSGTYQTDARASAGGTFRIPISLSGNSGNQIRLLIRSTSPSGASITRQVTYTM